MSAYSACCSGLIAAYAAIRIPLQSLRVTAVRTAVTPVWGQTPNAAMQADDLPTESAQPMFVQPAEPDPGIPDQGPAAGPSPAT